MLNILMITPDFPYSFGGIGEHVYHLLKYIDKDDIKIHLFVARFAESKLGIKDLQDELGSNVDIHEIKCTSHNEFTESFYKRKKEGFYYEYEALKTCAHSLEVAKEIDSFIKTNDIKFDLIHLHDAFDGIDALYIKQLYDIPLIVTAHSIGNDKYLIDGIRKYIIKNADKVIYVSNSLRDTASKRYHLEEENFAVIPNGVDMSENPKNLYAAKGKIVYAGRLETKKGLDLIIKALSHVKEKYKVQYTLDIYGEGTEQAALEKMAEQLGLTEYINFMGYKENTELRKAYREADIVVIPSREEAFGLVAIEAMSESCPVICSDIANFKELIKDFETGLFFNAGDSVSLADKIFMLMQNENMRKQIGQRAKDEIKQKYSWKSIAKAVKKEYFSLIK